MVYLRSNIPSVRSIVRHLGASDHIPAQRGRRPITILLCGAPQVVRSKLLLDDLVLPISTMSSVISLESTNQRINAPENEG